jgi:hypothetical protein
MQLHSFGIMGIIGTLFILAGAHLLWLNRNLAIDWVRQFVLIFRGEFARKGGANFDDAASGRKMYDGRVRSGALILVGAVALIFLGQALVLFDLTF